MHSDSWGSSSTSYDAMAAQVDLYTWENQARPSARDYGLGFRSAIGACVHSDSWASSSTSYDAMAAQVDLHTWENQAQPSALHSI